MRAFLIPVFILAGSSTHAQWITQSNFGNQAARAVAFSDADHGFVAVYGGFKRTADGGSSWADAGYVGADTLHRFYKETRAVHAFTADEAIACGVDLWSNTEMILRTVDGGLDWDTVHAGPFGTELNDLHFVSASIGMAVGGDGRIFRSLNGGYTWSAQVSGTAADLFGVYFVDAWSASRWAITSSCAPRMVARTGRCNQPLWPARHRGLRCLGLDGFGRCGYGIAL